MYASARNYENFMRISALLLCGLACSVGPNLFASGQPRGTLLELHSCELYAGGCVVSSEATLGGRYMLRAWQFTGGEYAGTDLSGLQLAVLQSSSDNLAEDQTDPGQAVVYLPESATPKQQTALLQWSKALVPDAKNLQTRTTQLRFVQTKAGYNFSAGTFVSVSTAPLETCETGACGEALWYTPRSATSVFTVAVDRVSQVLEPFLELKWRDAGRRSVFLGKFGTDSATKDQFVKTADLCGSLEKNF
jgi:hypothetical protein